MFLMDLTDTYFDVCVLPQELNYIILYNLDMKSICKFLGYDFCKSHKQFFTKIIKRDFGEYILTNLINYMKLKDKLPISVLCRHNPLVYDVFLRQYINIIKSIVDKSNDYVPTLNIRGMDIKFSDLEKIGIKIELLKDSSTNEYVYESMKKYETLSIVGMSIKKYSLIKNLIIHGTLRSSYVIEDVDMGSISNLIFFFSDNHFFDIDNNIFTHRDYFDT